MLNVITKILSNIMIGNVYRKILTKNNIQKIFEFLNKKQAKVTNSEKFNIHYSLKKNLILSDIINSKITGTPKGF